MTFCLENYSTLLECAMPKTGNCLIDVDNDLIILLDKDTYEWLWKTHEGVDDYNSRRCRVMMNDLALSIQYICFIGKWSTWCMKLGILTKLRAL